MLSTAHTPTADMQSTGGLDTLVPSFLKLATQFFGQRTDGKLQCVSTCDVSEGLHCSVQEQE